MSLRYLRCRLDHLTVEVKVSFMSSEVGVDAPPYSVGEVAAMMGVASSALRYYEAEGLLPAVERSEGGRRRYSDADLAALRVVECLKRSGLSIKEIKAFMDMCVEGDATLADRLELFRNRREVVRREIDALREVLDVLDFKTWYYEQAVAAGTEDAVRALPSDRTPVQHRAAKGFLAGIPMP